jgi:transcriptional regulator with XRE-family HTH domain
MTIGESMRAARERAGLTRRQLSERSGVHALTIGKQERDESVPRLLNTIDLADSLGITIDEYIGHGVRELPPQPEKARVPRVEKPSPDPVPFKARVREILEERRIPIYKFQEETGIDRTNFFYRRDAHKHSRYIHMAIAYYFDMDVEELIAGTDAEIDWYGDLGI